MHAFSLIEVLVFVTVFSLFFVIASTVVTTTLRITKENQNKIRATHYAEELREWLLSEKEINWGGTVYNGSAPESFTEQTTALNNPSAKVSMCFNTSPIETWPGRGAGTCYLNMDDQFRRIATFSASVVDGEYVKQISAEIEVEWKEGAVMKKVPIKTAFSIWE